VIVVAFVLVYLAGATAIAFWIDRRVPRLAPTDFVRAFVYLFAAAAANQLLDGDRHDGRCFPDGRLGVPGCDLGAAPRPADGQRASAVATPAAARTAARARGISIGVRRR
jgi:hypothetical protein